MFLQRMLFGFFVFLICFFSFVNPKTVFAVMEECGYYQSGPAECVLSYKICGVIGSQYCCADNVGSCGTSYCNLVDFSA
jgi:hypothetical protein